MKILFSCAVRGGRSHQHHYPMVVKTLKKYGTVLSEHLAEKMSGYGESDVAMDVHDREVEKLKESDFLVAEVTTPSLGVGYLIARALEFKKKIICLYYGDNTYKLTGMIKGNKDLKIYNYETEEDLEKIFESEIK